MGTIQEIIDRKADGIDCTEAESAEIKGWLRDTLIGVQTGDIPLIEDIQYFFPQEYGEYLNEQY